MLGLSFGELVIIAVLALILLGPDRLPDAARMLGKGLRQLQRATQDLNDRLETDIRSDEPKTLPAARMPVMPVPGGDPTSTLVEQLSPAAVTPDASGHEAAPAGAATPDDGATTADGPPAGAKEA